MYAIVEIAGQQFKVEKDQQIYVHRLDIKEGSKSPKNHPPYSLQLIISKIFSNKFIKGIWYKRVV